MSEFDDARCGIGEADCTGFCRLSCQGAGRSRNTGLDALGRQRHHGQSRSPAGRHQRESRVLAEVLPSEKASKVGYLQATLDPQTHGSVSRHRGPRGRRRAVVAMVGDGINDSPASLGINHDI
ncbi:uncharacterized protein UV8b_00272 [Ustilaginoidea virens]|nr:uncharacterized protein UV8b_00272 [Ustilaginoidea virens]QUC16031.1 hypothetical protein UV8b_00272 [Ustilaginoidea virens]